MSAVAGVVVAAAVLLTVSLVSFHLGRAFQAAKTRRFIRTLPLFGQVGRYPARQQ